MSMHCFSLWFYTARYNACAHSLNVSIAFKCFITCLVNIVCQLQLLCVCVCRVVEGGSNDGGVTILFFLELTFCMTIRTGISVNICRMANQYRFNCHRRLKTHITIASYLKYILISMIERCIWTHFTFLPCILAWAKMYAFFSICNADNIMKIAWASS